LYFFAGGAAGSDRILGAFMMRLVRRTAFVMTLAAAMMDVQVLAQEPAPAPQVPAAAPDPSASAAKPNPPQKPSEPQKQGESQKQDKAKGVQTGGPVKADSLHAQRKAAKLYLQGVRLLQKDRAEDAWGLLKQAAELEPVNATYMRAAELARQSAVTHLVEQASRERTAGTHEESAKLLRHALEIDPSNPSVIQRLGELGDKAASVPVGLTASSVLSPQANLESGPKALADGPIVLEPKKEKQSFHLRNDARQVVEQVFRAYGIEASVHDSLQSRQVRMDVEDATFSQAMRVLGLLTHSFYEPLDPHRVVVAQDTRENRTQFQRLQMETIYLPGMNDKELTEVSNLARNVFEAQQSVAEPTQGTLTLRATAKTLDAFNRTVTQLVDGKSQVDLEVKVIQLAHINTTNTGATFLQQTQVANAFSEINSILSQNQAAVQQIIASGLVPNATGLTNQLTIIGVLLASGQITGGGLFTQGVAFFGGGITESVLAPGPATLNLSLNSSDTRTLDDVHLRLADQEDGTFKTGTRYPIETSSYSSVAVSALASTGTNQTIPQIQYQDLGLVLKATPSIMRSNDVALKLDLKITALGGTSLNSIPILDSRELSGVVTLREGETAVVVSSLSKSESRALSGLPGISDIPGLQDVSDISRNQNVARLLILVTPTVVRDTQRAGHEPMLMVDKSTTTH
jgi:general secretion pathway protein D